MRETKIVADTSCDLQSAEAEALGVDLVPFKISLDGENYIKDTEIELEEFYRRISDKGVYPKASLPSPGDFFEVFERNAKDNKDIICVCLSSSLSGSYQSASTAAEEMADKYPEAKIHVIDSKLVTHITGVLIKDAVQLVKQGIQPEKIAHALKSAYKKFIGTLTLDSLDYLVRGGRISKAVGMAGSVLNIKPVLHLKEGALIPGTNQRGRRKVTSYLLDVLEKGLENKNLSDYHFFALYSNMPEYGQEVRSLISEKIGIPEADIKFGNIGTMLGCHGGPTVTIAGCIPKLSVVI